MPERKEICDCGQPQEMAEDPKCPVEFAENVNEFHLTDSSGGYWVMYFCPFCGGRLPESLRSRLFQRISDEERARLILMTEHLRTEKEVLAALGEPDDRNPHGVGRKIPEQDGQPARETWYPVMLYRKLSETADVRVTLYPNGKVSVSLQGKAISSGK